MHILDCSYFEWNKTHRRQHDFRNKLDSKHLQYRSRGKPNLKDYFQEEFSGWVKIHRWVLDPSKIIHRNKLDENVDKKLDLSSLESTIKTTSMSIATKQEL